MFLATNNYRTSKNSGFTLVELLVVISIIGTLAALLLANFVGVRERASDTTNKNDINQLKTALRLYYNDYQKYPDGSSGAMMGCGADGTSQCTAGGDFSAGSTGTEYMKKIPLDFSYYSDGADEFVAIITLSNTSDTDATNSQEKCDPEGRTYFDGTLTATDYVVCED